MTMVVVVMMMRRRRAAIRTTTTMMMMMMMTSSMMQHLMPHLNPVKVPGNSSMSFPNGRSSICSTVGPQARHRLAPRLCPNDAQQVRGDAIEEGVQRRNVPQPPCAVTKKSIYVTMAALGGVIFGGVHIGSDGS